MHLSNQLFFETPHKTPKFQEKVESERNSEERVSKMHFLAVNKSALIKPCMVIHILKSDKKYFPISSRLLLAMFCDYLDIILLYLI